MTFSLPPVAVTGGIITSAWGNDVRASLAATAPGLAAAVRAHHPLSRSQFYALQRRYFDLDDHQEQAAAFYVLNRSSFNGAMA